MALIQCPECTKDISTSAKACPHCGYPLEDYIKQLEINRLIDKILPCEFTVPEPRAKVCIKCAKPFLYVNPQNQKFKQPICNCGMPGVEIDYPQIGWTAWKSSLYMLEHCCKPRNIGDYDSQEYKDYIAEFEQYEKKFNTKIVPEPPDPNNFGVTPEEHWNKMFGSISTTVASPEPMLPKCPFCSSTDLTKISSLGKAAKISLFGLFGADDLGKTWKCNNCGGKF